jgi:hypothetical protein
MLNPRDPLGDPTPRTELIYNSHTKGEDGKGFINHLICMSEICVGKYLYARYTIIMRNKLSEDKVVIIA